MLFAAGAVEALLDLGKTAIGAVIGILGARWLEGYKIQEARRDAAEARRLAEERATRDQQRIDDQIASSKAVEVDLRLLLIQLSSQLAASREQTTQDIESVEENVLELGLSDVQDLRDEFEVEVIHAEPIPSADGVFILKLAPPMVAYPRFVHFSWAGPSFKIRDYIEGTLQQNQGATPQREKGFTVSTCEMDRDAVWASALQRSPTVGELYHPAPDFAWWRRKLAEMTEGNNMLKSATNARWSKDQIIETLAKHEKRATYGAIAGVIGCLARGLMAGKEKSAMNSWVVAATTKKGKTDPETGEEVRSRRGWPSGYLDGEIDPKCLQQIHERREDFIAEPSSLIQWLNSVEG